MTYIVQVQPRGVSAVKPKAGGEKEVRKVSGEKNLSEQQTLQFDLLKESLQEQVGRFPRDAWFYLCNVLLGWSWSRQFYTRPDISEAREGIFEQVNPVNG